jgi:hypothetical protein
MLYVMTKQRFFPVTALLFYFCSCAGQQSFSHLQEKQWKLAEVKSDSATLRDPIRFDRSKLKTEGMDDIFVLTFSASGKASGKAAPKTYTASYEQGAGRSLSFKRITSVPVERDLEPERLREEDYFGFLERINRWDYNAGKLELYSANPDGQEVVLIFVID